LQFDGNGLTAENVREVKFSDQTLYLGFALLSFSLESYNLRKAELSSSASELVLARLLDTFDILEHASQEVFGHYVPGYFVRDWIGRSESDRYGVPKEWTLRSDSNDQDRGASAMSLDQTVGLFAGWWAVARFSASEANKQKLQPNWNVCSSLLLIHSLN
jgi:hypothetical protein